MTRDVDDQLRNFLADEATRVMRDAPSVGVAVARLATKLDPRPARVPGLLPILLAAALLTIAALGSVLAIGSGLVRLPLVIDVPAPMESQAPPNTGPPSAASGNDIAYATEEGLSPLFLVRPDHEPQQVTPSGDIGSDVVCPAFSPDGARLAVGMPAGSVGVMEVDEDGRIADARRLDTGASESPHCVAWAPDSSAVALLDGSALVIVSLAGERQRIEGWDIAAEDLSFPTSYPADRAIEWSPDGASIAVARPSGTWLVPLDDTAPRRLHETPTFSVSWSPDGTRLVVGAAGPRALVIDVADGRTLTEMSIGSSPPVWSPVSDRIAFSDEGAGLVVVRPDGTGRLTITDYGYHPTWSPDGKQLLYLQDVGGAAWRLMVAASDGSGQPGVIVGAVAISSARSFPPAGQFSWRPVLHSEP
jgi:Tol biopolymer transport system component